MVIGKRDPKQQGQDQHAVCPRPKWPQKNDFWGDAERFFGFAPVWAGPFNFGFGLGGLVFQICIYLTFKTWRVGLP